MHVSMTDEFIVAACAPRLAHASGTLEEAEALLDAGADPNTGFFERAHEPEPTFKSALYGAAGVVHHDGHTRLLLARGADPNLGGEVAYHGLEGSTTPR